MGDNTEKGFDIGFSWHAEYFRIFTFCLKKSFILSGRGGGGTDKSLNTSSISYRSAKGRLKKLKVTDMSVSAGGGVPPVRFCRIGKICILMTIKFCDIYSFGPVRVIKIYVNLNHLQRRTTNFGDF